MAKQTYSTETEKEIRQHYKDAGLSKEEINKMMPLKKRSQDRKEIAYNQPYEVRTLCKKFKIKKKVLLELVMLLPHKHSRKEVEACISGYLAGLQPKHLAGEDEGTIHVPAGKKVIAASVT